MPDMTSTSSETALSGEAAKSILTDAAKIERSVFAARQKQR